VKEKLERYAAIKRLVNQHAITAQEELLKLLLAEGFDVTQATLSRDLKALGISKTPAQNGTYIYSLPDPEALSKYRQRLKADLLRGFVALDFSFNLALIKTHPGHAAAVAFALDNMGIEEILGTIAGDDTVLVIPLDGLSRDRFRKGIVEKIPELKELI